jgi:hypothetical protein
MQLTYAYDNLLPLELWRREMGLHPFHFWGLTNSLVPVESACNTLLSQYSWQNAEAIGRSELREAIARAEARFAEYAHFSPAPHFRTDELPYPRYPRERGARPSHADWGGRTASLQLNEGYLTKVGVERVTELGTVAVASLDDLDGDGVKDTFTCATFVLPAGIGEANFNELEIYFVSADRLEGETVNPRWRIEPVQLSVSGQNLTIRGRLWLIVKPVKYEGVSASGLDPNDASNFVTSLLVVRRYCDPTGVTQSDCQAVFVWNTLPYPYYAQCCVTPSAANNQADYAAEYYALGRVGIRDAELGLVLPGVSVYDATSLSWSGTAWATCRPPDRVTIRYQAGYPKQQGVMAPKIRTAIARLAAAELSRPICGCDTAASNVYRWAFDLARATGEEQFKISETQLNNPLGTRAGEVFAWETIQAMQVVAPQVF